MKYLARKNLEVETRILGWDIFPQDTSLGLLSRFILLHPFFAHSQTIVITIASSLLYIFC